MYYRILIRRVVRFTVILACTVLGIVPAFGVLAASTAPPASDVWMRQSDPPQELRPSLDIARAVPYPADFAGTTVDLGFLDGRFVSEEDQVLCTIDGDSEAESLRGARRQLVRAGWLRRYENRLAAPLSNDSDQFGIQVSSFVVEYASSEAAASAFAALALDHATEVDSLVGDESVTLAFTGTTPDTNAEYEAVKLAFRIGPLLCSMTYADLTGAPPDLEAVVAAAQLVAERARIVVDQGTVPLGSMVLQLTNSSGVRNDLYATRAGVETRLLSQSALDSFSLPLLAGDAFVSRLATNVPRPGNAATPTANAQSVISVEGSSENLPPPEDPSTVAPMPEISLFTALFAFNAAGDAQQWLSETSAAAANGSVGAITSIEAPPLGDESVAYVLADGEQSANPAPGYLLMARFGPIGIVQELRSSTGVSLEGAANVMRQQLACIAQSGCRGVAEVPQSVFGGRDRPLDISLLTEPPEEVSQSAASESNIAIPPESEPSLPDAELAPAATAAEPVVAESVTDVPEEWTEPEITSAPAPETVEVPVASVATDAPTEANTTLPAGPVAESAPVATVGPSPAAAETPTEVAETPVSENGDAPVAEDAPPEATTEPAPAVSPDAAAPEAAVAPETAPADTTAVPADGAVAPPPVNDVVQTPADSSAGTTASPEFTEPAPAATEADSGGDQEDREPRRDRDRKKDREARDEKE